MSAINERVSEQRLAHIRASYESSRKGHAFIGHPSYDESIAIIDELQQYRAAEPVTVVLSSRAGNDTSTIDKALPEGQKLYAAPQVTSVPPFELFWSEFKHPFAEDDELKSFASEIWSACCGAAPAVQAEHSGTTHAPEPVQSGGKVQEVQEPVSQPYTLPDIIEGMEVSVDVSTHDADAGHRYFGTVTEVSELDGAKNGYILLVQDAKPNFKPAGNSPVIPDGWIPVSERVPEQGKYISAVSRHGEYVSGLVEGDWLDLHDGTSFGLGEVYLWLSLPELPAAPQQEAE